LRAEYIDQDQPRSGSNELAVGEVPKHDDEVETKNRNVLATVDYAYDDRWGVTATLPVVDRDHLHIHNHMGNKIPESWDFTKIGDARVMGRYQWRNENPENTSLGHFGVNFGVKLPTGDIHERNADGDLAERTLQPGTGSTDVLLGAYFSKVMAADRFALFVNGLMQHPVDTRDDFEPGNRFTVDAGYRYEASEKIGLMLQLNALVTEKDSGSEAESDDSGGRSVYLSPGVSFAITQNVQVYGFFQQPIYQYVNGVQLTADWSVASGVSVRF